LWRGRKISREMALLARVLFWELSTRMRSRS